MEIEHAVGALGALAHPGRLTIYRMLVEAGPGGLTVGWISKKLKMPGATLSFHLSQLKHAGLAKARRNGREIIQIADFAQMNALVSYLTENCCGGNLAVCAPVCAPRKAKPRKKSA